MNIHGISGNRYPLSPLPLGYNTSPSSTGYASSLIGSNSNSGQVGTLVSAIFQALSQSGISGASSASSTGSTSTIASSSNPLQALGSFMQTLISALQNQSSSNGQAAPPPPAAATSSTEAYSSAASVTASAPLTHGNGPLSRAPTLYHHGRRGVHGGGASRIESNLQGLMQQLSSGSISTSASSATSSSATGTTTSSSTLDSLQQSFQALTTSLGNSSGSASTSLGNFLQAFSQNLEKLGSTGNIVNTRA